MHVLPSEMKMEKKFFTLHMDGYRVIKHHFLQDKLTLLSNHTVLLFLSYSCHFQTCRKAITERPDVLCYIMLYYNISETAKRSKKRSVTSLLKYLSCYILPA